MTETPNDAATDVQQTIAEVQRKLAERSAECDELLLQQAASAEILGVINSSHGDLAPVFDAMLEKAMRLCEAAFGSLYTFDGEHFQTAAQCGLPAAWADYRAKNPPSGRLEGPFIRLLETKRPVHIPDIKDEEVYRNGTAAAHALVDLGGGRTVLYVPLLKDHAVLGTIVTYRQEVRPFTDKQIALLENFAAQAVIAMENARLFNETKEALEQQAATSDILRVISQSPTDVQPVFEAIVLTAVRLTGCDLAFFLRCDGATYSPTARATPEGLQTDARPSQPIDPDANFPSRAIVEKKTLHLPDWSLVDPPAYERWVRETFGIVSSLYLPLLCAGDCIGLLVLAGKRTNIFGDREIALAESFRDQAVIAIENVRLFDEVQEALEHQTATSEVLQVISGSMADTQPVFERILDSTERLFDCRRSLIFLAPGDGLIHLVARRGMGIESIDSVYPQPIGQTAAPSVLGERRQRYIPDMNGADVPESLRRSAQVTGNFSVVMTPMLWEGQGIGMISVTREPNAGFTPKELSLLKTFADQAVVAIQNARMFNEVQSKTRDLTESLQFQTATSEVLKVISRSPDALQPVLDVIVETSRELCGSDASTIFLLRDGMFHVTAVSGNVPPHMEFLRANPQALDQPGSTLARVAREKRTLHYPNIAEDPELKQGIAGLGGPRALLTVPLMHDGQAIGVIVLRQSHLRPFTPRQIQAIETFADQAVIALSNVNLFEQVQERTRELSASLDDLRTAQDRLVQTEKLASLGQLTAGIAHEIKNPLNFVNNFSALSAELVGEMSDVLARQRSTRKHGTKWTNWRKC